MASAGSIFVDLLLNDAQFRDALKNASGKTKGLGGDLAKSAKVGAFAVAGLAGSLAALTIHQLHAIDATSKMARSLGISTKEFQALSLVADEAGVAQDQLASLVGKSQKAIYGAAQGGGGVFKANGPDV